MVFFFESDVVTPSASIYMGRDKYENEDLIEYSKKKDIWFHVDDLSSAHVYLKLNKDWDLDSIPKEVLEDCCQLVKANSIEGNKKKNIKIVYTPASNLKKEASYDVGQVSFKNNKLLRYMRLESRENSIVNRLNKTKKDVLLDYAAEKEAELRKEKHQRKKEIEEKNIIEMEERRRLEKEAETKSYKSAFEKVSMKSNKATKETDFKALEENFF